MVRMTTPGDLDADAVLEIFGKAIPDEAPDPNESLRQRKKRRVRQQISNMATAMFLVHGFDNVTVARIAAACEVSEQTVFNYFPTKESMFFDRSESTITAVADAVRERGSASLVEAVVQSLGGETRPGQWEALDEAGQLHLFRLFCDAATGSPTLAAARFSDLPRFIDEVSIALAQRIGADPIDPEVQLATLVIAGLLRVRLQSTFHHVQQATSIDALNDVVRCDILKAAQLAEPSLTAFDNLEGAKRGAFQASSST
jgi:AcrR family transcriptional regulator